MSDAIPKYTQGDPLGLRPMIRTQECYLYFPSGINYITIEVDKSWGEGKNMKRLIFDGKTQFAQYELDHVEKYFQRIKKEIKRIEKTSPEKSHEDQQQVHLLNKILK